MIIIYPSHILLNVDQLYDLKDQGWLILLPDTIIYWSSNEWGQS